MSARADALRWEARKANNRCGRCGRNIPKESGRTSCGACLQVVAEGMRKVYWRRQGIVPPARGHRPTAGQRRIAKEWRP